MAFGPGKYDDEATLVMERTKAKGVIVMVLDGDKNAGFSVQADAETTLKLPRILRAVADLIEADFQSQGIAQ